MHRLRLILLPALLLALLAPHAAQAKATTKLRACPAKTGTLAKDSYGRVWHTKTTLYGCTTVYGRAPHTQRLGPWKAGTKVAWDGTQAVFSVPLVRDGVRSDRLYAASAEDGRRWLVGTRALPKTASAAAGEARVVKVFSYDVTAGWVTTGGAVVFAAQSPSQPPTSFGPLPAAPVADGKLTLVGTWPEADPAALAATVKLDSGGNGDGDECGGSADYRLQVTTSSGELAGLVWWSDWTRPFCG